MMRIHCTLARLSLAVCGLIMAACAPAPVAPPAAASTTPSERQTTGIGYASVAEALTTLRARRDVNVSEQNGWTIISDPANHALWSFTPPGHPAHPAAVKRVAVQQGEGIGVQMNVLCQAERAACDKLVAEFQALNERMRQDIQRRTAPQGATPPASNGPQSGGAWTPSHADIASVERLTHQYFQAKDQGRYQEAYAAFTPATQELIPFERWIALQQEFRLQAGKAIDRQIKKITWYKDPAAALEAGIYAAVDYTSRFENLDTHCGYLVWRHQQDGVFRLVREEQNMIDKQTRQSLNDRALASIKGRFGC